MPDSPTPRNREMAEAIARSHVSEWEVASLADDIALALASARREGAPQWQPIETAPKADGTAPVIVWNGEFVGEAHFYIDEDRPRGGDWYWVNISPGDYTGSPINPQPTHWMPLPEPPSTSPGSGRAQQASPLPQPKRTSPMPQGERMTAREISGSAKEVLWCLFLHGPTWDGDVPSKNGRGELVRQGLAWHAHGYAGLTADGAEAALAFGFDRWRDKHKRERSAWQPIETAAKDELPRMIARFDDRGRLCWVARGFWHARWKNWNDGIEPSGLAHPTHWMFIPQVRP